MPLDLDISILVSMIKEEWRLHKSVSGGLGSTFFPVLIFIMTALCALCAPLVLNNLPRLSIFLLLHVAALLYGFFVGGFGAIGENVMTRRLGQVNMLLQLPQTYPITFRRIMAIFFVKDTIFYIIYTFIPMIFGAGIVGSLIGFPISGILRLGATTFLAFFLGMGLSFVVSALAARSRRLGILASMVLVFLIVLVWPLGVLQPYQIITPLGYWVDRSLIWPLLSLALALVLSSFGVVLMKERFEPKQRRYKDSLLRTENWFRGFGDLKSLVAKEWLELTRSGSLSPAIGSYLLSLVAVYFIGWLFEKGFGIPIGFNVVFFSTVVGFLGVFTYSSLTSIEHNEYLNVMPVGVDSLVKAKLGIYFLITSGVTFAYVVLIGVLRGEIVLIIPGLLVAACNSIFVAAVIAYLTGLWTNTMFFSPKIILGFSIIVIPLITVIELGVLLMPWMGVFASSIIFSASLIELLVSVFLFRRLGRRWGSASFSYVSAGS